jgi:peroxiredoxin
VWGYLLILALAMACGPKTSKKDFIVNGTITGSTAKMVYLEELPAGSTQPIIVDSAVIGKDGKFALKTIIRESLVYNLRLGQNDYPVAAVINDVPRITLNIEMKDGDNQFADKYEVKGSPASSEMKEFMTTLGNELQKIYGIYRQVDSLQRNNAADSLATPLKTEWGLLADKLRSYTLNSLGRANDPALFLFELGYYQSTANEEEFGLTPVDIEEVGTLVSDASKRFPAHVGLMAVKNQLDQRLAEMRKSNEPKWVGKPAPDFTLPDANGKQVSLSSFRGKYVLVDFWASWCNPCRAENPNVVKAYNKFKDRNFAILGVSLDNPGEKNKWLKAIETDKLTWTQVSDLKGWESAVVPIYDFGEVGIPFNILVNPEGVVIAERLKGSALETKLHEVLK